MSPAEPREKLLASINSIGGNTMVKVEASVDINRSIEEVFAYVTDPTKTPEWSSSALECTLEGRGGVPPGGLLANQFRPMGCGAIPRLTASPTSSERDPMASLLKM